MILLGIRKLRKTMCRWLVLTLSVTQPILAFAQAVPNTSKFVKVAAPEFALTHLQVIDGTGASAQLNQTVVVSHGTIVRVGPSATVRTDGTIPVIDSSGKTLIPGLVGMHEHLFFVSPGNRDTTFVEQPVSAAPLYLASGVTTARTAGLIEPYGDLRIKQRVDSGELAGPTLLLTGPYLESSPGFLRQMHTLRDADEARTFVRYWHSLGFSSMKAYMNIKPDQLRAAIEETHSLHMKITGHLCSVGFREAAEMGIDNLEHGPFGAPDGELYSGYHSGTCGPNFDAEFHEIASKIDAVGTELQKTIRSLVEHHVAVTSTLAPFEMGSRPTMEWNLLHRVLPRLLSPESWSAYLEVRAWQAGDEAYNRAVLTKEMQFEREFVKAGGLLLAGCDPTGDGHVLAGIGDQRELELLVEAGFSSIEAVRIATGNGARFLGLDGELGSVTIGKRADLVLLNGDLTKNVSAIENPEIVFKAGIGYDSKALYDTFAGTAGRQ